jgi:2-dehydro-3-deoxyphosphogluconate aldolase/(4S)-4-hydroxy-2-oxoglutarate aldolase
MTILGTGQDASRVIAIVRYRQAGDLPGALDALARGGIQILEVTLDTPGALEAIAYASRTRLTIGAGTVLDADAVRASAEAGATFVVSPGLVEEVVTTAISLGVEPIPGVLSPTELARALSLGARTVKVFPVGPVGGPAYVRALRGPFPEVSLVPTGGVAIDDVGAYLKAGAAAVGLGAALTGQVPPMSSKELEALRVRAGTAVEIARASP